MNKSEIAAKIKNAIEEKLCSLGAYVDKELPEYILVMIANKKSKESMAKDLQLFLGQETTSFIEWLHDLLEKCQTNPEDAFRSKSEKPPKDKSNNSPDKKKKVDKEKQPKIKSKSRKSDEKKDHRKGNLTKPTRNRSRSRSPKSEITNSRSSNDTKKSSKSKLTPDIKEVESTKKPTINKREISKIVNGTIVNESSEIERKKDDTHISNKPEPVEPKTVPSVVSTAKVTERPTSKKDIFKSSLEMVQRDLKEAEADISSKTESSMDKPVFHSRTSVFTRLGTNDLRSKLGKNHDESQDKKSSVPLKRTIHNAQVVLEQDTRESKVKRLETDTVSPCFIVTLNGADKLNLNKPLTSRLGPKRRNSDMLGSAEEEDEEEGEEMFEVGEVTEGEEGMDSKENDIDTVMDNSQSTRCRFWPTCKNKDTCPFLHPTEPCKTFPACKFGALCNYIHPNCRFSGNCAKPDCPYTHYRPRSALPGIGGGGIGLAGSCGIKQGGLASIPSRCLYYPHCTNVNCKFFHPNLPCKFGLSCKQKELCLFYHPSIPKITELKWTASHKTVTSPAIIDTSNSKKAEIQTA